MNKDHDYQKMIAGILNLNNSDIETINVYEEANNPVIYVTLKRKKGSVCPYCSSQMYRLNGFYARKIIVDNDFIVNEAVVLKVRRYVCKNCGKSFSDSAHLYPKGKNCLIK